MCKSNGKTPGGTELQGNGMGAAWYVCISLQSAWTPTCLGPALPEVIDVILQVVMRHVN
jgi:hypothetical protein